MRGAEGVASAIHAIADVAMQTEKGVMHAQQTAEELARVAEELTGQLAKFKLAA